MIECCITVYLIVLCVMYLSSVAIWERHPRVWAAQFSLESSG